MSSQDLINLKASYSGNRYFNATILNTLVDEIVALNEKIDGLDEKIDGLDEKIDGLHP